MKENKTWFTLVELIIVITILAILTTIGFISFGWNIWKANKSKIVTNLKNINTLIESKLSMWNDINDFITGSLIAENWVNTGSTISSWAYILWDLNYKVWNINFFKLKLSWKNFKIETNSWKTDYIFSTLKTPDTIFYQIAWEIKNESWKNEVIIYWKYFNKTDSDAKWLISEKWYDIWLKNNQVMTWSLY